MTTSIPNQPLCSPKDTFDGSDFFMCPKMDGGIHGNTRNDRVHWYPATLCLSHITANIKLWESVTFPQKCLGLDHGLRDESFHLCFFFFSRRLLGGWLFITSAWMWAAFPGKLIGPSICLGDDELFIPVGPSKMGCPESKPEISQMPKLVPVKFSPLSLPFLRASIWVSQGGYPPWTPWRHGTPN